MANLRLMHGDSLSRKHVLFIHGLGGDAETTWQSNNSKKIFWPKWLSEDIEGICIWSIGYEARMFSVRDSGMGLLDRAQNILETLLTEKSLSNGEIIMIGHSLGGLIIKQMLRMANDQSSREEAVELVNRVSGIAFLGSPHTGADLAHSGNALWGRIVLKLLLHEPSAATASLERNDATIRELNTWYRGWCYDKTIRHLVLFETKPYSIFGMIVKADSADPGLRERAIPIDSHHINISKPYSKEDEIYRHVKKFVETGTLNKCTIWLRAHWGNEHSGWEGYGNWAFCPKGIGEEYVIDKSVRLHQPYTSNSNGLTVIDAINLLRAQLAEAGSSVRLVGLSGVGKTRFAQALFDERIGKSALDKECVFYSDISRSPSPTPRILVEKLIRDNIKSVIIVDNCGPDLHRELTKLSKGSDSVSILTIEYDVREDQPEETDVYTLEPNSCELIEEIISSRFKGLSKTSVQKIAEFSGGNARVAIALAPTVSKEENISRIKDEDLFKRLFYQRHNSNAALERAAEGLSLVYSFQLESDSGFSTELELLSEVVMIPAHEMYTFAQELKRRNLAQQRNIWMAVLPHPIANKLATLALQNVPFSNIIKVFNSNTDYRLLTSFSRRIGYLNGSSKAIKLSKFWLEDGGVIDSLFNEGDSNLSTSLMTNIAPIIPDDVLTYLDTRAKCDPSFFSQQNTSIESISKLIRSLAYKDELFSQCFELLSRLALTESKDAQNNFIRPLIRSLFKLYLSGTHATLERRTESVEKLTKSIDENERELGYELLDSALDTSGFSSSYGFDFGAESRDYGYEPRTRNDVIGWYRQHLLLIRNLASVEGNLDESIKNVLAKHFRSLWRIAELHDELELISKSFAGQSGWPRGWMAIGATLRFDSNSMTKEHKKRLEALRADIAARDLDSQMELLVFSNSHDYFGLDELNEEGKLVKWGHEKAQELAEELGILVVKEHYSYLSRQLRRIFTTLTSNRHLLYFGRGVAHGARDSDKVWNDIVINLERLEISEVNSAFIQGFIGCVNDNDSKRANLYLDKLLENIKLNEIFPLVQLSCPLDKFAIDRLVVTLKNGSSPSWMYSNMASGRRHEAIPDSDLITILDLLWLRPNGNNAVIEILTMRFHDLDRQEKYSPSTDFLEKSREFLLKHDYGREQQNHGGHDYSLAQIAKVCFSQVEGTERAKVLFNKLAKGISTSKIFAFDYGELLATLVKVQPVHALNIFLRDENVLRQLTTSHLSSEISPFSYLASDEALKWCKEVPNCRFNTLASAITPYEKVGDKYKITELAKALISHSPKPELAIEAFVETVISTSMGSSFSSTIEKKAEIFNELLLCEKSDVKESAEKALSKLEKKIQEERINEELWSRKQEERFEW